MEISPIRTEVTIDGLTIGSDFDGGNIGRIEKMDGENEYMLWTRADCEGTAYATKSRTWFCFSVRGATPGQELVFEVKMTPQVKLYEHGMRPVYRSLPSKPEWVRVSRSTPCNGARTVDSFSIRIRHTVDTPAGYVKRPIIRRFPGLTALARFVPTARHSILHFPTH